MWGNNTFGGGTAGGGGGGGGFVTNQFQSPTGQAEKTSKGRRSQNIIPVTCKQLVDCSEDLLKIEGTDASVVTIVGLVKHVETTTTKNSFLIDDHTATIEAVNYVGTDGEGAIEMQTVVAEGTYARVVGGLRSAKSGKYIIVFKVSPITDMNEVTFHALEVIHAAMKLKKLSEAESMKTGVGINAGFGNILPNSMIGGSVVTTATNDPATLHGFNQKQTIVFRVISACKDDSGIHKLQIIQNLQNKMSEKEIMEQLEFLSGEGHIFSSLDDDHYKSTDWA